MKKLTLAFCFLDEDDNIFVKKDLNVSWTYQGKKDKKELEDISLMNEVTSVIDEQVKIDIDKGVIRELLNELKGIKNENNICTTISNADEISRVVVLETTKRI